MEAALLDLKIARSLITRMLTFSHFVSASKSKGRCCMQFRELWENLSGIKENEEVTENKVKTSCVLSSIRRLHPRVPHHFRIFRNFR